MNNEIKEKQLKEVLYGLDYIGNKIKNDDGKLELGRNNCKLLLDYITNLQESEAYYYGQYKDYKSRNEKATEILKDTSVDMPSTLLIETIDYGINILNGKAI